MTATYVIPAPNAEEATLPTSAHRETTWAREMRIGLNRHGATPIHDQLRREFDQPRRVRHTKGCSRWLKVRETGRACDCGARRELR